MRYVMFINVSLGQAPSPCPPKHSVIYRLHRLDIFYFFSPSLHPNYARSNSRRLLYACTAVRVSQYIRRRRFIVPRITTTNNLPTRDIKAASSPPSHIPRLFVPYFENKVSADQHLYQHILTNRVSNKIKKCRKNNDLYFYICGAGCAGMTVLHIILPCGFPALRSQGPAPISFLYGSPR